MLLPRCMLHHRDAHSRMCYAISVEKTIELIHKAPLNQSALDPISTWILKECASELAPFTPFISRMFNLSVSSGIVPLDFKASFISPILKKFTLDKTDVNSYRPISNFSVISKTSRAVCSQLVYYLDANSLMLRNQSAYRRYHSTESALTVVFTDIIQALD